MSTETHPNQTDESQTRPAGGSPGSDGAVENAGSQSGDASSQDQGGGEDPSSELARLRAEHQKLQERAESLEGLRDLIDGDDGLRTAVMRRIKGEPAKADEPRGWARVEKTFADAFEDSPQTRALSGALKVAFEESVNAAVERLEPQVRGVAQVVRGTQFERVLSHSGVSAEIQESPAFAALLREKRAKPTFRQLEQSDPAYAAEILSEAWRARSGARATVDAERRRVETAKNGGLAQKSPRGTASVSETVKVKKGDLVGLRSLFAKGLTREQIEIV
jgi:hypothetical protein